MCTGGRFKIACILARLIAILITITHPPPPPSRKRLNLAATLSTSSSHTQVSYIIIFFTKFTLLALAVILNSSKMLPSLHTCVSFNMSCFTHSLAYYSDERLILSWHHKENFKAFIMVHLTLDDPES